MNAIAQQYIDWLGRWEQLDENSFVEESGECSINVQMLQAGRPQSGCLKVGLHFNNGKICGTGSAGTFLPVGGVERSDVAQRDWTQEAGLPVLVRRPYRQCLIRTQLQQYSSRFDWSCFSGGKVLVYGMKCPGLNPEDGSKGQTGTVTVGPIGDLHQQSIEHIDGLQSIAAAFVPIEQMSELAFTHNITIWQTCLVPASEANCGTAPELQSGTGFRIVPFVPCQSMNATDT